MRQFLIKRIGNWISLEKDLSYSTTTLPFNMVAIVKNDKLTLTSKEELNA